MLTPFFPTVLVRETSGLMQTLQSGGEANFLPVFWLTSPSSAPVLATSRPKTYIELHNYHEQKLHDQFTCEAILALTPPIVSYLASIQGQEKNQFGTTLLQP